MKPDDIAAAARELDHLTMEAMWTRLRAAEGYLNDICDAYERWKNLVEHGPGHGISDPDYPGPSNDEIDAHEDEVGGAWNDLEDAIEAACGARGEP